MLEEELGAVLGVGRSEPSQMLARIGSIRAERAKASGQERPSAEEIENLIRQRREARAAKNFAESDRIRNELDSRGVVIQDSAAGTTWRYK